VASVLLPVIFSPKQTKHLWESIMTTSGRQIFDDDDPEKRDDVKSI
jgi:hypothetical protein